MKNCDVSSAPSYIAAAPLKEVPSYGPGSISGDVNGDFRMRKCLINECMPSVTARYIILAMDVIRRQKSVELHTTVSLI